MIIRRVFESKIKCEIFSFFQYHNMKILKQKKKVFLNKYFRNCFFQAIFVRLQIISSDKKLTQNCYSTKSFARLKILQTLFCPGQCVESIGVRNALGSNYKNKLFFYTFFFYIFYGKLRDKTWRRVNYVNIMN